eukprot:scaffold42301_cov27-Tisochrysis_lutea.AAC.4
MDEPGLPPAAEREGELGSPGRTTTSHRSEQGGSDVRVVPAVSASACGTAVFGASSCAKRAPTPAPTPPPRSGASAAPGADK